MINVTISSGEHRLVIGVREIAFGEIYDAVADKLNNAATVALSDKEARLVFALREYGKINKIIIHDNEPTAAEITGVTQGGLKCLKKLRF